MGPQFDMMESMFNDGIVDINFEWKSRLNYWTEDEFNMMTGLIDSNRRPEDLIMTLAQLFYQSN